MLCLSTAHSRALKMNLKTTLTQNHHGELLCMCACDRSILLGPIFMGKHYPTNNIHEKFTDINASTLNATLFTSIQKGGKNF